MRGRWCDMMAAAAAGETPNVCDGYATEKVIYTWPGLGTCVGFYCESCAADNAGRFPWPELGYPVSRLAARSVFVHCRDCRRPI